MIHRHRYQSWFDPKRTKIERSRKAAVGGGTEFAAEELPRFFRQCDCGSIQELIAGNWQESKGIAS